MARLGTSAKKTPTFGDGTGSGLIAFLEELGRREVMNDRTAAAYQTAVRKVMASVDGWESQDVRSWNTVEHIRRFDEEFGSKYSDGSLKAYKARFTSAIKKYRSYLEDRPPSPSRTRRPRPTQDPSIRRDTIRAADGMPRFVQIQRVDDYHLYPFPLTGDETAYLYMPRTLTEHQAERLSAFVGSLAIESQQALFDPDQED